MTKHYPDSTVTDAKIDAVDDYVDTEVAAIKVMTDLIGESTYKELNFSQAGAAQNTWYTALEGANIAVNSFAVGCTVADETLEVQITIDSVVISSAAAVACTFAANPYSNLPAIVVGTTGAAVFTQGVAAAAVTSLDSGLPWLKGKP